MECKRRPPNATVQILETKTWRVAMRGVAVPYAVLAAVLVSNAAVVQNDPGQPSPSSPSAQTTGQADNNVGQAVWQAPIGHRQPSAKEVPPRVEETWASDHPRTGQSTGSCASVAIANLRPPFRPYPRPTSPKKTNLALRYSAVSPCDGGLSGSWVAKWWQPPNLGFFDCGAA